MSAVAILCISTIALWPMTRPGLWADDWTWYDELVHGNLNVGGPYYDVTSHANPLPVEVQVNRLRFALFADNGPATHTLDLAGHLVVLVLLYALIRRLGGSPYSASAGMLLAGISPAPIGALNWISASVHMWATLLALVSILCYLAWSRDRTNWPWIAIAALTAVMAVWTKNDGVLAPVFIILYELVTYFRLRKRASLFVAAGFAAVGALFVAWQATAEDPIRASADPSLGSVLPHAAGLLELVLLPHGPGEVQEQLNAAPKPVVLLAGLAVVAAAIVVAILATVSLVTRPGRLLVASGVISSIPVMTLEGAVDSRYCYPLTLCIAAAAAIGLQRLSTVASRRGRKSYILPLATTAVVATAAVWGGQTRAVAFEDSNPSAEADALLAGVSANGEDLSRGASIELIDSPLEPNTAAFRFKDPSLPGHLHSHDIRIGGTGDPHLRVLRRSDGVYVVLP